MGQGCWRWTETDPRGRPVYCGDAEWRGHVLARHPALADYEAAVRITIRQLDAIYHDAKSTADTADPEAEVEVFIAGGHTSGRYAGLLVFVAVKWHAEGPAGELVGYLRTAYLTDRILHRLHLRWEQSV